MVSAASVGPVVRRGRCRQWAEGRVGWAGDAGRELGGCKRSLVAVGSSALSVALVGRCLQPVVESVGWLGVIRTMELQLHV